MGKFLRQLGEQAFARKWWFIGGWITLLVFVGFFAAQFYKAPSSTISIPGTEAQTALDRFSELFPDAGQGSARIVFAAKNDTTITEYVSEIDEVSDRLADVEGVSQAISPSVNTAAISKDDTVAYISLQLDKGADEIEESTIEEVEKIVSDARSSNLDVEMGGDVISKMPGEILGIGEVAGVVLALVVLVVTLGSLVAAGLPIVVAIVSIGAGIGGLFALSQVVDITATTPVLAIMLGLAVGIDYSLFIVNKYRHYLLVGYSHKEAAGRSIATAGNAVIFAAATVVIALSALAVVNIPFMTTMGVAGAATVALAAVTSVTLLPALLGVVGAKIFGGKTRRAIEKAQKRGPKDSHRVSHRTVWYKLGERITKHPIVSLLASLVVVVTIALPITSLQLGLPTDEYAATNTTERKAYDLLKQGFGAGFNAPLLMVVENLEPVTDEQKQEVRAQLEAVYQQKVAEETAKQTALFEQRAKTVTSAEQALELQQDIATAQAQGEQQQKAAKAALEVQIAQYSNVYNLSAIAERIADLDGVDQALPALVTENTKSGVIQVIPTGGPSDQATVDLIAYLRDEANVASLSESQNITFGVTGSTALQSDINEKLAAALPLYLFVVVGLSLILLVIVFRSILVPIKATLGFLLSVAAMFGALVAIFQWGWFGIAEAPGPIVSFIPIIAIGILFGLAMDYEFFLVSSMHEEYVRTKDAKRAVANGYGIGARVVVAAGFIMVSVFAGFITNHDSTIQAIGFGLAIGILVDAFIVRLIIVPAVMTLLGKGAWWIPKWLEKRLPHLSIEGEE